MNYIRSDGQTEICKYDFRQTINAELNIVANLQAKRLNLNISPTYKKSTII